MNEGPLVILHSLAPAPVGGLEEVVRLLAGGHAARGHAVHVALTVDDDAHTYVARLREDGGARVHPLVVKGRRYLQERRVIRSLCEKVRPHVVHTHGYRSDVVTGSVAGQLGLPRVSTVHGFTGGDWKNRVYERIQVRCLRDFEAVVAVSEPLRTDLARRGLRSTRMAVIPNAMAPEAALSRSEACARLGLDEGGYHVGWVGRLSHEKGIDLFIEAVGRWEDPVATAVVIGEGPMRNAMQYNAARGTLRGRVRFCGSVPEAGRLLSAFDVFVLSSRTEGTPMVLLEAMAARVPIVATRVGGVPDVVSNAEALLVPSGEPDAIAEALTQIRTGAAAAGRRADAALARLRDCFSLESWLDEYETLYRGLSAGAESGRRA